MDISETIAEYNPEALTADGFDDAIIGIAQRCGQDSIVAYDADKIIDILQQRDSMSYDDAVEYFEFNIAGAYCGPHTPIYITRLISE